MTSTIGREPVGTNDGRGAVDGLSVTSLSPPTRRRPSWIAVGALVVVLAGLLGAYVLSTVSDTVSVTVAAHEIAPGEVLGPEDIRVVEMGHTNELRAVQASQQDLILGLAARGPIPEGTTLNTGMFVAAVDVVPAGKVVVGGAFEAGAVPVSSLQPGDDVGMLRVASGATVVPTAGDAGAVNLGPATVWSVEGDVSTDSSSSRLWVSLLVDEAVQGEVASATADESLRLVLLGSS